MGGGRDEEVEKEGVRRGKRRVEREEEGRRRRNTSHLTQLVRDQSIVPLTSF